MLAILSVLVIFFTKAAFYPIDKPSDTGGALGVMLFASLFLTYWSIRKSESFRWVPSLIILGLYVGTFVACLCAVVPLSQVGSAAIAPFATKMAVCALVQAFGTATFEEAIFREFIQHQLAERVTARRAIVITAVAFYLMHLTFLPTPLLFGLTAGVLRAYSGNLVPSIMLHTITNTIGYLAVTPPSVATQPVSEDLTWLQLVSGANSVSLIVAATAALAIFTIKRPATAPLSHARRPISEADSSVSR